MHRLSNVAIDSLRRRLNVKFSTAILNAFRNSPFYDMINKVSHDDESIVRKHNLNSKAPIEIGSQAQDGQPPTKKQKKLPPGDELDKCLQQLIDDSRVRLEKKAKLEEEALLLAKRREEWEEAEWRKKQEQEQQETEERRRRQTVEAEERRRREERETLQARNTELRTLMDMLNHSDENVQRYGKVLLDRRMREDPELQ
ncbi:hypothetical protein NM688_g5559 [Phlebia brevispora]|uniref:Uncharacterized protein n=1 Tax=Phlebia brevispora TaxID=194682 RepID=A0ACC1STL9_9APHY|nr:hypothetical protein NM688_g5559 [Phlebia brevispora]